MQTIGILGGMGPQASIRTYQLVIDAAIGRQHARANDDFPYILLANIPVPDLIGSQASEQVAVQMVRDAALRLRDAGADFLIMPCNTMHLFARDIFADDVPFISMIEAVVAECARSGFKKVGVLGSPTSLRLGLYQRALAAANLEPIVPEAAAFPVLLECIQAVIAGTAGAQYREYIFRLIAELRAAGAEAVILGCTELPLLASGLDAGIPLLDSPLILAEAAASRAYAPVG